jgi:hypothetical protein
MTLVHASQRRAIRRATTVECQVVREHDFKLIGRWGLDVSRTCGWLDCEATVARVVHGRRPSDRARGLGLQFHSLGSDTKRALDVAMRRIPPPLPAREKRIDYAATIHMAALEA